MAKKHTVRTLEGLQALFAQLKPYLPSTVMDITVAEHKSTRSLEQNDKLQAICRDFHRHYKDDPIFHRLKHDDWRALLSGAFHGQQTYPWGDKLVMVGKSTSGMKVDESSQFIEWLQSEAIERGVTLTDGEG